jgi:hypothetical protein
MSVNPYWFAGSHSSVNLLFLKFCLSCLAARDMAPTTDSQSPRTARMEARRARKESAGSVDRPPESRETEGVAGRAAASIDTSVVDAAATADMAPARSTDDPVVDDPVVDDPVVDAAATAEMPAATSTDDDSDAEEEYVLPEILDPDDDDSLFNFFVLFCKEAQKKRHFILGDGKEHRSAPAKKFTRFVAALIVHYT